MARSGLRFGAFAASAAALLLMSFSDAASAQVVAFGASNVAGAGVSASEAFPAQLEAMLRARGRQVTVRNAGISGDTTSGMLERLSDAVPQGTTIVILDMSGGVFNDARAGIGRAQGRADMALIGAKLKARGIRVIPETAVGTSAKYLQADGRHLTAEGHRLLALHLLPPVIRALGQAN